MLPSIEELESALANEQFFVEYMPIVRLKDETCVGAEALIRWRREADVVEPMDFIPLIENTPLSGLVTYWVIDKVAQELGQWLRQPGSGFISVNVPPEILGRGGLMYVATKCGLLDVVGKIVIEVTERGIPDHLGIKGLAAGKKLGIKVCLDDVGANDENLVVLARAHVDMIKLDKSFADNMLSPGWQPSALGVLAVLANSTPMQIIAEGVQTGFQRDAFRDAGIQMAQGWYYSQPLSASRFMEFSGRAAATAK